MKNNRIKNYLKLVILLFGISALSLSCETDLEIQPLEIEQSKFKTKTLNKREVETNTSLSEKLNIITNTLKLTQNENQHQAKGINNDELGITIYTDQAKYLEDTSNGNHSYSFFIRRNSNPTSQLENLLLHVKPDGGYNAYIVSYGFNTGEYDNLDENQINRLSSSLTPIDLDTSNFENGVFARMVYGCGETWEWNNYDVPHNGQLHGADCARPACMDGGEWVMTSINCGWYDDGNGNGSSSSSGGDGGGGGNPPRNSGNGDGNGGNNGDNGNDTFPILGSPLDGLDAVELIDIIEQPVSELETIESFKNRLLAVGTYFALESHSEFSELSDMLTSVSNDPSLEWGDYYYIWNKTKDAYDILKPYTLQIAALDSLDDINTVVPPLLLATAEKNLTTVAFLPQIKSLIGENWPQNAQQWSAIGTIMGQFLLEIGLAVIPGSDIIGVANGFSDNDYLAVTLGIAGLVVDAFGGTIIKVIGKIGKVAYKTFKIFKIVFRYLDEVVDAITLGYKTEVINGLVKITTTVGNTIAEIQDNVIRFITNSAKSLIKVADLKFLDNVSPSVGGNISKGAIDNSALKIRADNSDYADDIADIVQNGDLSGNKTEALIQDLLQQDGYVAVPSPHLPSNQGFDNVLIRRNGNGNITDVIINESKQVRSTGNITLSSNVAGCGNCTQMSDDWIQYTIDRMRNLAQNGNNTQLQNLGNELNNFNGTITQIVSGVNKNTGELLIVNITGFN